MPEFSLNSHCTGGKSRVFPKLPAPHDSEHLFPAEIGAIHQQRQQNDVSAVTMTQHTVIVTWTKAGPYMHREKEQNHHTDIYRHTDIHRVPTGATGGTRGAAMSTSHSHMGGDGG